MRRCDSRSRRSAWSASRRRPSPGSRVRLGARSARTYRRLRRSLALEVQPDCVRWSLAEEDRGAEIAARLGGTQLYDEITTLPVVEEAENFVDEVHVHLHQRS